MTSRRKLLLAAMAAMLLVDAAMVVFGARIALFVINASAGCWPWSPGDVEYHDGMTICPGQSAHLDLIISVPKRQDTGI